jgi:hypothetical protein
MWANSINPYIKNWAIYKSPVTSKEWLPFGPATPNPSNYALSLLYNSYLNSFPMTAMDQPSAVLLFWAGSGKTATPGYTFSYPLVITKSNGFLQAGQFGGTNYVFQRSGADCVSGYGYWGGDAGSTADMRVFQHGQNVSRTDSSAKYVPYRSPNSPVADVNRTTGYLETYWVNGADWAAGCPYSLGHSPFRTQG